MMGIRRKDQIVIVAGDGDLAEFRSLPEKEYAQLELADHE